MEFIFNPADHYWLADDGRVYGSKAMGLVPANGPAFESWKDHGGISSAWPRDEQDGQTDASLAEVLSFYGLGVTSPAPRLPGITPRQFAAGLWGDKIITYPECDAYVSVRTIPDALQAILDTLADDDTGEPTPRKDATILLKGATTFEFDHSLVDIIREAQGWDASRLRERWTVWATL